MKKITAACRALLAVPVLAFSTGYAASCSSNTIANGLMVKPNALKQECGKLYDEFKAGIGKTDSGKVKWSELYSGDSKDILDASNKVQSELVKNKYSVFAKRNLKIFDVIGYANKSAGKFIIVEVINLDDRKFLGLAGN